MPSNFQDKLRMVGQDQQPNVFQYSQEVHDPFPFSDQPSGSTWGRPHLDWLQICYEWECDLGRMFTKKSRLEESGTIVRFLQDKLNLPWNQVTTGNHESGSLYDRLSELASWVEPTPAYKPDSVPPSSSPARSQQSDISTMLYYTHGDKVAAHPTLEASPSGSPKPRSAPSASEPILRRSTRRSGQALLTNLFPSSQDSEPFSEPSSPDKDPAYQPVPSSPPGTPLGGIDGLNPDNRLEKEVEFAATAFLYLMIKAFKSTETGLAEGEIKEQDLVFLYATPRGLKIKVDDRVMESHPDLALGLLANGTKAELVVEVKPLNHHLTEAKLLAQQFSEMFGATLKYRRVYKRKEYIMSALIHLISNINPSVQAYLVSWHFLECYICRMEVTKEYLAMLQENSHKLITCLPPTVQRSRVFDMTDPAQRIHFATMAVRIGIELLYQYPRHRGNGAGLVRRLRGVTPSKISEEEANAAS